MDKNSSNFIVYRLEFWAILRENFRDIIVSFHYLDKQQDIWFYNIRWVESQSD